jgi:AcrR family transcriptional regulator
MGRGILEDNKSPHKQTGRSESARERIIETAYELFSKQGTRSVGIDTIIERSGVAKMTLYRHFRSKQALVVAFMERRAEVWMLDWLIAEVKKRASSPREQLLAIFDVFDEWFNSDQFDGCSFINILLEYQQDDPLHDLAAKHLAKVRDFVEERVIEANVSDAQVLADNWHILMKGSIVAASEGNRMAARGAKRAAALLLNHWPEN